MTGRLTVELSYDVDRERQVSIGGHTRGCPVLLKGAERHASKSAERDACPTPRGCSPDWRPGPATAGAAASSMPRCVPYRSRHSALALCWGKSCWCGGARECATRDTGIIHCAAHKFDGTTETAGAGARHRRAVAAAADEGGGAIQHFPALFYIGNPYVMKAHNQGQTNHIALV